MLRNRIFLLLGLAAYVAGVRVNDKAILDEEADPQAKAQCVASLKELHSHHQVNRLFKPLLEGRYRLRNRYSGKYLTVNTEDGQVSLYTSRAYLDSSGVSEWDIMRVKGVSGGPRYTVMNNKLDKFLTHSDAAGDTAQIDISTDETPGDAQKVWYLEPGPAGDPDGIYNTISIGKDQMDRVFEEASTTKIQMRAPTGDKYEDWKSHWELEIVGKPFGRVRPRSARGEYEWQWDQAGNIPMYQGGTYTFLDMCKEANQEDVCKLGYADIRSYYLSVGKVAESGGNNVVTENSLQPCDTSISLDRQMFSLPGAVDEVKALAGPACKDFNRQDISSMMRQSIEEKCYDPCLRKIRPAVADFDCTEPTPEQWDKLGSEVFESSECKISPSTLVYLIDWTMQEKCWTWHNPNPLWIPQDKGPGVANLARADGEAVCSIPKEQQQTRNEVEIFQKPGGTCPEGTACECPPTWRSRYKTITETRIANNDPSITPDSFQPGENQPNFFIADSSDGWLNIRNTMRRSLAIGSVVQWQIFGRSLTSAVLATPMGAPFVLQTGIATFGFVRGFASWKCGDSVGCWPQEPKRMRTQEQRKACRLEETASKGGSPYWFMPPPGFMLYHTGSWYNFRKCELKPCAKRDMLRQRVEFGENKQNVYNCQPLSYEFMTDSQRGNYTVQVQKTVPKEYEPLPALP